MVRADIDATEGRHLFGADAAGYERGRPAYPEPVFELLAARCGLGPGARVLEIGAGNGLASRALLARAPAALTLLEPDARFGARLRDLAGQTKSRVGLIGASFEDAELPPGSFDLIVAATSFHWVSPQTEGLAKAAQLLRPGGWLALFWNVFGDPRSADPFHDATQHLLATLAGNPSHPPERPLPFSLDEAARLSDLEAVGAFEALCAERFEWTLVLDAAAVRGLYATFSPLTKLPTARREEVLDALEEVARSRFDGCVLRHMTTPVYLARSRAWPLQEA